MVPGSFTDFEQLDIAFGLSGEKLKLETRSDRRCGSGLSRAFAPSDRRIRVVQGKGITISPVVFSSLNALVTVFAPSVRVQVYSPKKPRVAYRPAASV